MVVTKVVVVAKVVVVVSIKHKNAETILSHNILTFYRKRPPRAFHIEVLK